jgi:MarR family transcriptional regulator for hemolysin
LQYDHRQSLPYWIISTAHALEVEFNEVLAPLGITFRQAEVLALLALEGTLSQVEVARRMGVEAPTLAGIVARMEAAGWIVRESCPSDRRKKLLRATERVEPIWAQTVERAQQVRARLALGFTPEQIQGLIAALEMLYNNLKQDSPKVAENAGVEAQEVPG